jgi:hypothetical protein
MLCHSQHLLSIEERLLAMLALYTTGSGPLQAAITQQQGLFSMLHRAAGRLLQPAGLPNAAQIWAGV